MFCNLLLEFSSFGFFPCLDTGFSGFCAVSEAVGLITGFDDMAMMGQPIQQRSRHLGVAEDAGPFGEAQIGRDDDTGAFVEFG